MARHANKIIEDILSETMHKASSATDDFSSSHQKSSENIKSGNNKE